MEPRKKLNGLASSVIDGQSHSGLLNLTDDILAIELPPRLDDGTLINYAKSCKSLFFSVHTRYLQAVGNLKILLDSCARRDQEEAGEILMQHPNLLMCEGTLTDGFLDAKNEKRKFKAISAVKYSAWALDMPMLYWLLLSWSLSFVPDNNEKEEVLAWITWIHAKPTNKRGVTYQLTDLKARLDAMLEYVPEERKKAVGAHIMELEEQGTEHGQHYNLSTLENPLTIYVNHPYWTLYEREAYWGKEVRDGQRQTVQQVADEYCRLDRGFYPRPTFKDDHLPHTDRFSFVDCTLPFPVMISHPFWHAKIESGEFLNFAIYRCSDPFNAYVISNGCSISPAENPVDDLVAVSHLYKVRTNEFKQLVGQLKSTSEPELKRQKRF